MTIAVERYLAVCQPFKHSGFTKRKVVRILILIYVLGIFWSSVGAFQVTFLMRINCLCLMLNRTTKSGDEDVSVVSGSSKYRNKLMMTMTSFCGHFTYIETL